MKFNSQEFKNKQKSRISVKNEQFKKIQKIAPKISN